MILYNLNIYREREREKEKERERERDVHTFSSNWNFQDDTSIRQSSNSERRHFREFLTIVRSA